MTGLLILLCFALIVVLIVQIGKVSEISNKLRGEEAAQEATNKRVGLGFLIFGILFLIGVIGSAYYYKNYMLGFGPHVSASAHGGELDRMFDITLIVTGIVFFLTHIALFWFAYRYSGKAKKMAKFMDHDTKLEMYWTAVPAIAMTILVMFGLSAWNRVMADISDTETEDVINIEATGYQFAWALRYPGADNILGERQFELINTTNNPLGQNWKDKANADDMHVNEIVLPKGKKVRVRINSKDVLHSFFLPHFRVKMDAVPGMPTYFVFTPDTTTAEYRKILSQYKEYQRPDPEEPEKKLWETFNFELACAELCGKGHFSMRKLVRIVEQDEYEEWLSEQKSHYMENIRFTEDDPYRDELFPEEISIRKAEFDTKLKNALSATNASEKIVRFDYVNFATASANLTALSKYELDNLVTAMKENDAMKIELAGHTDSVGDDDMNMSLSQARAEAVYNYLTSNGVDASRMTAKGYGETQPIDDNATEEGRAENRRTEFRITAQ